LFFLEDQIQICRQIFDPSVKKQLWGSSFWSAGYFVNTVSRHYYPDNADPLIFKARNTLRRRGANFNFGVMTQASGIPLSIALYIAQQLANNKHPIEEQYAVAAGWTWEDEKEPALDYSGRKVFTFNLTTVPYGKKPF
jgi:hypothetical protein